MAPPPPLPTPLEEKGEKRCGWKDYAARECTETSQVIVISV